ncbi:hypothetical protein N9924_00375 [bacterium]|jgi:hypothetical protein|nr:hypothetical protein [bacterium]
MNYEVHLAILVDKDANFLEISGDNCVVLKEIIEDALYDIDDVTVTQCEVNKYD